MFSQDQKKRLLGQLVIMDSSLKHLTAHGKKGYMELLETFITGKSPLWISVQALVG